MVLAIGNKNYSSWSLRPWLAMKHFHITFTEIMIPLDQPDTNKKIAEVSPSGRVPALKDGAIQVWESLAIMEYLAESNPACAMWPKDVRARAMARSVANEMHSSFMSLRQKCPMKVKERLPGYDTSEAAKDIARIEEIWTMCRREFGARGPYLFGDFSIADAMFAPVVFRVRTYDIKLNETCRSYCETMLAHPAMQEWEKAAMAESFTMARYEAKK